DRGIEADGFESRCDVVREERVNERKHCINIVERRAAVAVAKSEGYFVRGDKMIEDGKVCFGGFAFSPAQFIKRKRRRSDPITKPRAFGNDGFNFPSWAASQVFGVVAERAWKADPTVPEVGGEYAARVRGCGRWIVGGAILRAAQKHIAGNVA